MPDQFILWLLCAAVTTLIGLTGWLGKRGITKLDEVEKSVDSSIAALKLSVTDDIGRLRLSVATDMGGIRERLARLEGHAGIGK